MNSKILTIVTLTMSPTFAFAEELANIYCNDQTFLYRAFDFAQADNGFEISMMGQALGHLGLVSDEGKVDVRGSTRQRIFIHFSAEECSMQGSSLKCSSSKEFVERIFLERSIDNLGERANVISGFRVRRASFDWTPATGATLTAVENHDEGILKIPNFGLSCSHQIPENGGFPERLRDYLNSRTKPKS